MNLLIQINSLHNPGGMERVVLNKATWLCEHGYDVTIVTTDQKKRPTFYTFPQCIKMVDLDINYSDDVKRNIVDQIFAYLKKRRLHKKRLSELLFSDHFDIVDTLYPGESSFIPNIKDGSKKVLELHQNKFFHRQYANKGIKGLVDRFREVMDERMVKSFDKFVVLTEEDKGYWGNLVNMTVIPNAAIVPDSVASSVTSSVTTKRVIAVGRLDFQKSFDRLIDAWKIVCEHSEEWILDIYGQGEWKDSLQRQIDSNGISDRCYLRGTTSNIWNEYINSSILAMSSHYEGLPMVLIESMACGIPPVSFDFKCGPKDIIDNGINGFIVKDGDVRGLADSLLLLLNDSRLRKRMSTEAVKIREKYSEESVMTKWESLYNSLLADENTSTD